MFDTTFETLFNRALARVDSVDNSEGSFIYDALSMCIIELYELYLYCNELEKRCFADTSYNEYLERRTEERGISRKQAVQSKRKAQFDASVPIGSEWGKEDLIFTVTSDLGNNQYILTCNTVGSIGNKYTGDLINISAISGVSSAILGDIVIAGEDEEDDESLRTRYFNSFNSDSFGGNIADYKQKVSEIEGVGQVKIIPCWNGVGTVKVLVLTTANGIPNQFLLDDIKEKLDPLENQGLGYGLAPIGHTVTVESPQTKDIEVKLNLEYKDGYNFESLKELIEENINDYFTELVSNWTNEDEIIVRTSYIQSRVLDISGVQDVLEILLNGSTDNIVLDNQIPVLAGVSENE